MKKQLLHSLLALTMDFGTPAVALAAPPTNAEVGDADSFGARLVHKARHHPPMA